MERIKEKLDREIEKLQSAKNNVYMMTEDVENKADEKTELKSDVDIFEIQRKAALFDQMKVEFDKLQTSYRALAVAAESEGGQEYSGQVEQDVGHGAGQEAKQETAQGGEHGIVTS